jgi:hypothetical protein
MILNTKQDGIQKVKSISRVEVIDDNGRQYTIHDAVVTIALQDNGRTLKLFIEEKNKRP